MHPRNQLKYALPHEAYHIEIDPLYQSFTWIHEPNTNWPLNIEPNVNDNDNESTVGNEDEECVNLTSECENTRLDHIVVTMVSITTIMIVSVIMMIMLIIC